MELILARFGLGDRVWLDPATAGVIVLISIVVAFLFHKVIIPLTLRLTNWTPTDLDSRLVKSLRWPLTLGILALGAYLAVTISFELTSSERDGADDIARGVLFLAADNADFITGSTLSINGGQHMY